MRWIVVGAAGLSLAFVSVPWLRPAVAANCGTGIDLVSRATSGTPANDDSEVPAVNGDGCVVAFKSNATNLASGTGTQFKVFLRDRSSGTTTRIPPTPEPNNNEPSFPPALNACVPPLCAAGNDGQVVAFASGATNFLPHPTPADANNSNDVFVYDRSSGKTESLTFTNISGDNALGGGGADKDEPPSVCADGSLVAFVSTAYNLVSGENADHFSQVYVHDRGGAHTDCPPLTNADPGTGNLLVSVAFLSGHAALGASAGAAISGNGCIVAFYSDATDLVPGDTNADRDVFVRNICAGTLSERVNVSNTGDQAVRPSDRAAPRFASAVSYDGRYVVFASDQGGLDDVCSGPAAPCYGVLNVFVRDRCESNGEPIAGCTLSTVRVSKRPNGEATTSPSQFPSISGDGRFVVFQSSEANLVDPPTNGRSQIFVVDFTDGIVRPAARVSVSPDGDDGNGDSINPQISGDGSTIVFQSTATNLVGDSTGSASQIFAAPNPPTPTFTNMPSPTGTETPTPTNTVPTSTPTDTPTPTPTLTSSPVLTPTPTATPPVTVTAPPTETRTLTPTVSGVASATPTRTVTTSLTATVTPTMSQIPVGSPTQTPGGGTGGGGGGGCSCGIDPGAAGGADPSAILALAVPLLLGLLRHRPRRS